jgi:dipeptidase D
MIPALANLQPEALWKHFDRLAAIPRASTKEAAAREYVLSLAKKHGLESVQDDVGNLVVRKPARPGREGATMALLQGHLDMVCEKNEGTIHDFDVDPIKVKKDGDWLKADGTTLGSDNGVGVAAALAVMESNDIAHGPLEFVFTIDEETGTHGSFGVPGWLAEVQIFSQPRQRRERHALHRLFRWYQDDGSTKGRASSAGAGRLGASRCRA